MYCIKLKEILDNEEGKKHKIDISIIKKLDLFLKNKVTYNELDNINPARFSLEMSVDYETTIKLFKVGKDVGFFQPIAYYRCNCGEKFLIYSKSRPIKCPNGCMGTPKKERIYVMFRLVYAVEQCDFIDYNTCIADTIEDDDLGKSYASYTDFEEILGPEEADDLLTIREQKYKGYLE